MQFNFFTKSKNIFIKLLDKIMNKDNKCDDCFELYNEKNEEIYFEEKLQKNEFVELDILDIDVFLEEIKNIDNISTIDLLKKFNYLNEEQRKIVLKDDLVINKLHYCLLNDVKKGIYDDYGEILNYLSLNEFLSLYDAKYLKEFLKDYHVEESKIFYCLCKNNINEMIKYIIEDDEMFDEFFEHGDYFSFKRLNYDLLKRIVLKMEKSNLKYRFDYIYYVSAESQKRLLSEDFKDDTILKILSFVQTKILNDFFENNARSKYLISKVSIPHLLKRGIKFSYDILKSKEFFESLKSHSFVQFRTNINNVEKNNVPIFVEEKIKKYYEELISSYNPETKMFKEYDCILEKDNLKKVQISDNFILFGDFIAEINKILRQSPNNKEKLISILKQETSKKLSEIIIDAIFQDNIYNVFLNINEMIRYNELLANDKKILTKEKLEFYKLILEFDKIDNNKKVDIYNKLKDKNYNLVFYEDLRKLKNLSYENIKKEIISPSEYPEYIDRVNSQKYGVNIYNFKNKKYIFLVRKQWQYQEKSQYEVNCYSLISNENNQVFNINDTMGYIYGYSYFEKERVVRILECDAYSSPEKEDSSIFVNRIMTSREIINSDSGYSELQIINKKCEDDKFKFKVVKPDYLVVFNKITYKEVDEAKRLNIPIVIIKEQKLSDKNKLNIKLDRDIDIYVDGWNSEKIIEKIRKYR